MLNSHRVSRGGPHFTRPGQPAPLSAVLVAAVWAGSPRDVSVIHFTQPAHSVQECSLRSSVMGCSTTGRRTAFLRRDTPVEAGVPCGWCMRFAVGSQKSRRCTFFAAVTRKS